MPEAARELWGQSTSARNAEKEHVGVVRTSGEYGDGDGGADAAASGDDPAHGASSSRWQEPRRVGGRGTGGGGPTADAEGDAGLDWRQARDARRRRNQPGYAYEEVVRKKADRARLQAFDCPECEEYYAQCLADGLPVDHIQQCGRHRGLKKHKPSPPNFWDVDFPSSATDPQQRYSQHTQEPLGGIADRYAAGRRSGSSKASAPAATTASVAGRSRAPKTHAREHYG